MTLPPLATASDVAAFGYDPVAPATLVRASTRVRRYTGQMITPGTSSAGLVGSGPWRLPQRPVQSIVEIVTPDGARIPNWQLLGQVLHVDACAPLTVTYTHGFDPIPDVLADLVCQIASRIAATPAGLVAGVRTEQAGAETVTWGSDAYAASSGLTDEEKEALDQIYPKWPRSIRLV